MNLTKLKKQFKLNQKWHCFNHWYKADMGTRELSVIQSNAIAFKTDKDINSWHYFEKANRYSFLIENNEFIGFIVNDEENNPVLTYTLKE